MLGKLEPVLHGSEVRCSGKKGDLRDRDSCDQWQYTHTHKPPHTHTHTVIKVKEDRLLLREIHCRKRLNGSGRIEMSSTMTG